MKVGRFAHLELPVQTGSTEFGSVGGKVSLHYQEAKPKRHPILMQFFILSSGAAPRKIVGGC